MTAQEELLALRRQRMVGESARDSAMAVEALMQGRTESELRAAVACLERGMPWEEVAAWLMHARTGISGAAYERALQLFADSQLLRWEECVRVGEPLAYRSPALEALSRR